jgi:hypothetical protein
MPSVSAISAAVKRSRRSLTIASIRSSGVRFATRRGADEAIDQTGYTGLAIPAHPLTRAATADSHRRRRRRNGQPLNDDKLAEPPPTAPAESGVSVQIHPVTSLGPSCL